MFPQDGFIGEESGKYQINAPGIWVVDPIDGTKERNPANNGFFTSLIIIF